MKIKFKRISPDSVVPSYAKVGDGAVDLVAISKVDELYFSEYGTGLAIEVPENHVALLFPRSSITNKGLILGNSVGVIDSGYRGEIKFRFYPVERYSQEYQIGDKIGQMMIIPYPKLEFEEVEELSETDRGTGGYGSTGS